MFHTFQTFQWFQPAPFGKSSRVFPAIEESNKAESLGVSRAGCGVQTLRYVQAVQVVQNVSAGCFV
jgi:hypothetical protein